jgi:hypothetical protein
MKRKFDRDGQQYQQNEQLNRVCVRVYIYNFHKI